MRRFCRFSRRFQRNLVIRKSRFRLRVNLLWIRLVYIKRLPGLRLAQPVRIAKRRFAVLLQRAHPISFLLQRGGQFIHHLRQRRIERNRFLELR